MLQLDWQMDSGRSYSENRRSLFENHLEVAKRSSSKTIFAGPLGCTRARGDPLSCYIVSRYTYRSRFTGVLHVWQWHRATPPPPIGPVARQLPGVSHVKLPFEKCRATGECIAVGF